MLDVSYLSDEVQQESNSFEIFSVRDLTLEDRLLYSYELAFVMQVFDKMAKCLKKINKKHHHIVFYFAS